MKIAIISDVHANLEALKATIKGAFFIVFSVVETTAGHTSDFL